MAVKLTKKSKYNICQLSYYRSEVSPRKGKIPIGMNTGLRGKGGSGCA